MLSLALTETTWCFLSTSGRGKKAQ